MKVHYKKIVFKHFIPNQIRVIKFQLYNINFSEIINKRTLFIFVKIEFISSNIYKDIFFDKNDIFYVNFKQYSY